MFLPDDIINVILSFSSEYELVDWILMEKLNWNRLCSNPYWLCQNPAAIHLLEQNIVKINWDCSSSNLAIHSLELHEAKIN